MSVAGGGAGTAAVRESKFVGMRNLGATCYINSLLQALYVRHAILKPSVFKKPK